jgi:hypothetical protein
MTPLITTIVNQLLLGYAMCFTRDTVDGKREYWLLAHHKSEITTEKINTIKQMLRNAGYVHAMYVPIVTFKMHLLSPPIGIRHSRIGDGFETTVNIASEKSFKDYEHAFLIHTAQIKS